MQKTFKNNSLRVPPQNIEGEKALLGSIMLKPDVFHDIVDIISPDVFYTECHRKIFRAMLDLYSKNQPIDLLSLSSRLKEKKELQNIGGSSYLTEIIEGVPSSANVKYYADIIYKKFILRNIIVAADHIAELGYNEHLELEQLIDEVEKKVLQATNINSRQKFALLKPLLTEAFERIEKLHNSKGQEIRGIRTGFTNIDDKLAGLQKSDLIIIAARPSVGKTALALDIARQTAIKYKTKVGIFSLEMSSQQLVDRMLSAQARVDSWRLRTGKLNTDEDFLSIQTALGELSKAPIFIDDNASNTVLSIRSVARKMKKEQGLDLIIVDYLQLIHPTKNYDSMVNQVTEISRALKGLARELEVPVLALSQLSRAIEQRGGRPRLSDLRDSGSIEQDADVVMFIHRDDKQKDESEKTNIAEILIEKHRNGPTGKVELYFNEKKTSFEDLRTDIPANTEAEEIFDNF
ncbi:replicative DNA helicase [Patescibacteria group bacterium]|nr:replicative DNA helicase [Patescibacteria group bacterium]MBU1956616.1 replicative DNA helicase [Patescibacteria group bacterium]MBU2416523.1 replicative DNA helicase [Patescibacteria group bacterium]